MEDREQLVEREKRRSPLSDREMDEADDRSSTSAKVVHEAIRLEGTEELERPSFSLWWSGVAAGLTMGCSMVAQGILEARLPDTSWRDLVAAFGYCLGFLFVTMGRQQLFTETTLTVMLPVLHKTHGASDLVRYWAIVFVGNMVATVMFAAAVTIPGLFPADIGHAFVKLGTDAATPGFLAVTIKAVFAGWLIALMVWLLPFAEAARVFVIIILTYLVGLAHLPHIVASAVDVFYLATTGVRGWGEVLFGFLLPTLIGNVIGGTALVAALAHAQTIGGDPKAKDA